MPSIDSRILSAFSVLRAPLLAFGLAAAVLVTQSACAPEAPRRQAAPIISPQPQPQPAPPPSAPLAMVVRPEPPPPPVLRPPTGALPTRVEGGVRVAILLPLSGRDAGIGKALLEAAEMAVFDFADPRFVLLPQDTEIAGPAVAAERALADGAKMILGPLFGRQVGEVASVARPRGVPVLSFSNDGSAASPGVFVMGVTPEQPVARAVAYARSEGLTKFAGLLPSDALGQRVGDGFRRAVEAVGGTLVQLDYYGSSAVDISAEVRQLASVAGTALPAGPGGTRLRGTAAADAARAVAGRPLGIEAIILGESGARLRSIAPQLPYYDLDTDRIRVIGSSTWEDATLGREPALANAWFAAPDPAARVEFEKNYASVFGRAPPRLATLAYDATGLAAVLARSAPGGDFSIATLTQPSGFSGADGLFRLRPDGSVERGLAVLQILPRGAGIKVISPAPASFEAKENPS
jgi:branched-chain amino acid transport system substrate-binding protein